MASLPLIVKYLIVFVISMVPIVELRGAIPIAESLGLNIALYYPIAIIGNMLPVPVIYLFARKVLEWGKDKKLTKKFFTWCLEKGEKGGEKLKKSAGNSGIFWALLLFVGIPLPGTGACMRMEVARSAIAKSSCKLKIRLTLTSALGRNSKVVTTGPV